MLVTHLEINLFRHLDVNNMIKIYNDVGVPKDIPQSTARVNARQVPKISFVAAPSLETFSLEKSMIVNTQSLCALVVCDK